MAIVTGTNGNDTGILALFGTAFADTVSGLAGDDELFGQGDNDILVGGAGSDKIDGGAGQDTVSYLYASSSVVADLDSGWTSTGGNDSDKLYDIEILWGSNYGDLLYGSGEADTLVGWGGDDFLTGRGGGDVLSGGAGLDVADYFTSAAAVQVNLATGAASGGDAQGDVLLSIEGLGGSAFADTLVGDAGANRLFGFDGNDVMRGGGGADLISGGAGKDSVWGGTGADVFKFGVGGSAATKANADIVKDYSEAQGDKIDLTAFGGLDFIGSDAFTSTDQARVTTSGGHTFVAINLSGGNTPEMWIRLDGVHSLEQNDFLL